jgi:uncharacterized repeat protein (TIGR03843 family)
MRTHGVSSKPDRDVMRLLEHGELEPLGVLPRASNYTFLARVRGGGDEMLAVYKPRDGEAPLWDFPQGTLCNREVAAYVLAEALRWPNVPQTVLRDGPHGVGSVQRFVAFDPNQHYFTMREERGDEFRRVALFDIVANNADRKAGHCLRGNDDHIWGIDHGVSFHAAVKLRTVIWDYEGEPISEEEQAALGRLAAELEGDLGRTLAALLNPLEVEAVGRRLQWLLNHGVFPRPVTEYPYPWPMV